jgi:hypothetical protein
MRISVLIAALCFITGCASYITPGAGVRLNDINRADIAEIAARKPAANFPARIAVARVQAPDYRSPSARPLASGRFSVITAQELLSESDMQAINAWPQMAGLAPINRLLLPATLDSVDDLRASAAKVQADILLVYTIDTSFRVQGRGYGPLTAISLGLVPDRDAYITSTASAVLMDVRTGFIYGLAESTAKTSGLTNAWGSKDKVDRKRIEAEQQAFRLMLGETEKTWSGVSRQYGH